jgi:hypothetical protein
MDGGRPLAGSTASARGRTRTFVLRASEARRSAAELPLAKLHPRRRSPMSPSHRSAATTGVQCQSLVLPQATPRYGPGVSKLARLTSGPVRTALPVLAHGWRHLDRLADSAEG